MSGSTKIPSWITRPCSLTNANLGNQVVAIIDNVATGYAEGSRVEGSDWVGGLVPLAKQSSSAMNTAASDGGTLGMSTHNAAWATVLHTRVANGLYSRRSILTRDTTGHYLVWRAISAMCAPTTL